MLFNSWVFPVFFLIVFALYVRLRHRPQNLLLLMASYVFYGWWDWRFLSLLAISTVVDYHCAQRLQSTEDPRRRKLFLYLSLCVNLGFLGFFKYFNFFCGSAESLLLQLGMQPDMPTLQIILPVGISFYTFQTMAYTIDVYRRKEVATKDFLSFAVYVSFFPQLVAGPIERSTALLPQIQSKRRITLSQLHRGSQLVLIGYFKKVFIADGVAPLVNQCFDDPASKSGAYLLIGVYLFAIQIYGDFSGYTDIARGISRMLGIELCLNFKQPYLSRNITEFWRRWHISLSSWLRDYLYIPLGGNRRGALMTYRNLFMTMLLGGLWHGAGWTFVIWGALHGSYLAIHKLMTRARRGEVATVPRSLRGWLKWTAGVFVTFHLVCFAWIFFRAPDLSSALLYVNGIGTLTTDGVSMLAQVLVFYGFFVLLVDFPAWFRDAELPFRDSWRPWLRGVVYAVMVILISFVGDSGAQPFIYFQF